MLEVWRADMGDERERTAIVAQSAWRTAMRIARRGPTCQEDPASPVLLTLISNSMNYLCEFALLVLGRDQLQFFALDLGPLALAAELEVALLADLLGGFARGL